METRVISPFTRLISDTAVRGVASQASPGLEVDLAGQVGPLYWSEMKSVDAVLCVEWGGSFLR